MERGPQIEPERGNEAMNGGGKSDDSVLPGKLANKGDDASPLAERVEGRESAKGNSDGQNRDRAQKRAALQSKLDRVRQKAKRKRRHGSRRSGTMSMTSTASARLPSVSSAGAQRVWTARRGSSTGRIISHEWLEKFISHRIADKRVLRHVKKWLKAGVLEEGEWKETTKGSPQGGSVSPLLANVYLHYVFDLWADLWRSQRAKGDVIIVRFADDVIVGFEHREDAERLQEELAERLRKFDLELHPDKTRLIRFGRSAHREHRAGGGNKPGTSEFLGFVHICGTTRKGGLTVKRRSSAKRMQRTLLRIKEELLRPWHLPIRDQGVWLGQVVRGWFGYHGVPFNIDALSRFRHEVVRRRVQST